MILKNQTIPSFKIENDTSQILLTKIFRQINVKSRKGVRSYLSVIRISFMRETRLCQLLKYHPLFPLIFDKWYLTNEVFLSSSKMDWIRFLKFQIPPSKIPHWLVTRKGISFATFTSMLIFTFRLQRVNSNIHAPFFVYINQNINFLVIAEF